MKVIGLIGGMSWESTELYYRLINETVRDRLGGLHSARVLLYSVDFAEVERLQHAGDWHGATRIMCDAARRLAAGGADSVVICTNTMHRMADEVGASVDLPLLVPDDDDRAAVHRIIYEELCRGEIREESREVYRGAMQRLEQRGAGAIILGCTEITLLVGAGDCGVPVFDTTALHARAAVAFALGDAAPVETDAPARGAA